MTLALLWLASPAMATTVATSTLAVGVAADGSLCDGEVCLRWDPSATGGDAPLGADLLTPGNDFEAWGAEWTRQDGTDQRLSAAAPDFAAGPSLAWEPAGDRAAFRFVQGEVERGDLTFHLSVDLPTTEPVFWVTTTITARAPVSGLRVSRSVDLDPDHGLNGSYTTDNVADGPVALSSSKRPGGKALALAVAGGRAYLCPEWCTTPSELEAGMSTQSSTDDVIGVVWGPVDLAAGETVQVRFAYALATSPTAATDLALDAMNVEDLDGDGVLELDGDCDDREAATYPGAAEIADGLDNDCDEIVDEDTPISDDDGDGFTEAEGDCDDGDPDVHPGADSNPDVSDANCDGFADRDPFADGAQPEGWGAEEIRAGACDHGGGAVWLALFGPALWFRRRRCAR